ncbi:MAG: NUDIX hydrolase [Myxococcota bacterium]
MTDLQHIRDVLAAHDPMLTEQAAPRAAVAVVLRPARRASEGPRVLLIRRARADGDPWSGQVAFPGGRVAPSDDSLRTAAERETREEVGLDLAPAEHLGRLDDLAGRTIPIVVSAFVYALEDEPPLHFSHEVDAAAWIPFSLLLDPAHHVVEHFEYRGLSLEVPAIETGLGDGPPLWGLTYRFLELLLGSVGHPLPAMPWREDL